MGGESEPLEPEAPAPKRARSGGPPADRRGDGDGDAPGRLQGRLGSGGVPQEAMGSGRRGSTRDGGEEPRGGRDGRDGDQRVGRGGDRRGGRDDRRGEGGNRGGGGRDKDRSRNRR